MKNLKLFLPTILFALGLGCAHNYFGVPNVEWEARKAALGEPDVPQIPPSAGDDSLWTASSRGAWAAGINPAGMTIGNTKLAGALVYGSHTQNVNVNDLMSQTSYDTVASGSRIAFAWQAPGKSWALGSSVSFPSDFTYRASDAGSIAESSGAISQLSGGGGLRLTPQLSIGGEVYGLWGQQSIKANYGQTFLDEDRIFRGYDFGGGVQYRAQAWQNIILGWGAMIKKGAKIDAGRFGTIQQPPYFVAGVVCSYYIYRVSAEASYRSWSQAKVSNDDLAFIYSTFNDEMRAGGALDFMLGSNSKVSAGYQRMSIPIRNDNGFRMFDSRYGVGGSFPLGNKILMGLGLWFGTRGDYGRDSETVNNIILTTTVSFL